VRNPLKGLLRDVRGLAAVEFALCFPALLIMLGGLADFSLAFWTKGLLANSVAQGVQYALLTGPQVSPLSVRDIIRQKLGLSTSDVDVSQPSCKCVSGTPATARQQTCGLPCLSGGLPGTYMTISARYTYTSLMPLYSKLANPVLTETATVKLK